MLDRLGLLALAAVTLAGCDRASPAITVTGSSTVLPFTTAVADAFVKANAERKAPAIEATGTGAGIERFCGGAGGEFPDVADASRRMRRAEYDKCQARGVGEIMEIPIGLDGIALAESNAGPKLALSRKDIYLALAANPMGKANTARTWKDVNPALPALPIRVLGPPATSGTRDAFVELMLEPGCLEAMPAARELKTAADPARHDAACRRIRSDAAFFEEGDDTRIVQALSRDANTIGLIGYSYLENNTSALRGIPIDGVAPAYSEIASGKYPGVRSLYLYVKKRQLEKKPELHDFLKLYATMWAPGGPLTKQGLIPLPERARNRAAEDVEVTRPLDLTALR